MTSSGKNPFLDDDEVNDFEFLNHPPQGQSGYLFGEDPSSNQETNDLQLRRKMILAEKSRIEERTLQSTFASLSMVHESEQVGIATAEELVQQREQLENVEKNLDSINSTMRISQKHINSIKSMFGGLKSYFSGGNTAENKKNEITSPTSSQGSALHETIGNLKSTQKEFKDLHPALRTRGINYDEEEEEGRDEMDFPKPAVSRVPRGSQDFEDKLDKNLDDLSLGLGRLKNLAIGLNTEMEDQNQMLDRVYVKADHADDTIEYQNRQIKRILKK